MKFKHLLIAVLAIAVTMVSCKKTDYLTAGDVNAEGLAPKGASTIEVSIKGDIEEGETLDEIVKYNKVDYDALYESSYSIDSMWSKDNKDSLRISYWGDTTYVEYGSKKVNGYRFGFMRKIYAPGSQFGKLNISLTVTEDGDLIGFSLNDFYLDKKQDNKTILELYPNDYMETEYKWNFYFKRYEDELSDFEFDEETGKVKATLTRTYHWKDWNEKTDEYDEKTLTITIKINEVAKVIIY